MGDIAQVLADAVRWTQQQLDGMVTGWGMTGVWALVGFAIVWKLFLRAKR